jgi:hypothetical protein
MGELIYQLQGNFDETFGIGARHENSIIHFELKTEKLLFLSDIGNRKAPASQLQKVTVYLVGVHSRAGSVAQVLKNLAIQLLFAARARFRE